MLEPKRPEYEGRHRTVVARKISTVLQRVGSSRATRFIFVPLVAAVVAVFGIGSVANAKPVHVAAGDTFSALVRTHCKTGDWQGVSFPSRNKNLIYAGETINIDCPNKVGAKPAAKATAPKAKKKTSPPVVKKNLQGWYSPLPGRTGASNCNFWQWRPSKNGGYNHRGEDWPAPDGTPIRAAHSGYVSVKWNSGAGGNYTVITHNGMAEVYMHQSRFKVTSGWVSGGQIIGYVGHSGQVTGPHLHFEVQPNGPWNGVINPVTYLRNRGVSVGC